MRLLVIGAGGHAKVVIDAAEALGWSIAAVVSESGDGAEVLGHKVGRDAQGVEADGFIVAVGDNRARARVFEEYRSAGLEPLSVIHPSAVIAPSATIGAGTFVAAGAIVNPQASVGENVILNTGCVVEHDVVVGAHSLIGPASSLCGAAEVGTGVLFGAGSTARPLVSIGAWSTCGAGSVVVSDLPPNTVCVGVPARPIGLARERE